jgi:hypothetical protein
MPDVANTAVPQVFSGARARFLYNNTVVGYAGGVSGEETIDYEVVDVLDLLEVKEHVPVAYRTTLNAQVFRVVGNSLKAQGIFPKPAEIITLGAFTAAIEDAEPVSGGGGPIQLFVGVRCSGHRFDVTARGIVSENVNFVAIRTNDESESALA